MDKLELKQLVFKILSKEPSYVGNAGGLYWESEKYMIKLLLNCSSDKYNLIVYARTNNNAEIKVFDSMLDLEESDFLTIQLTVLKYKQAFRKKLFRDLTSETPSDPMDELLEEPKDE